MAKSNKNKHKQRNKHSKSGSDSSKHHKPFKSKSQRKNLVDPQSERESSNYENPIASRELILKVIHEEGAMLHENIIEVLELRTDEQLEALRRRLNAMVRDGQLIRNRRDGYVPVNEEDLISGRVIAHADGFGFLVPDEGGDDIFLHGRQMRTLLHGDKCVVQISGKDRRGRLEGAVINVTERANDRIVGRLFIESGMAFVVADNKRITHDFMIPQNELGGATHGQIVIVEITQQPSFKGRAIGRISDIIGDHMAPGMEIDIAIHAHNIPFLWPDDVKQQVARISAEVIEADKKDRRDLTGMPLLTIDGEDARDFDDAVYCEKSGKGWKLYVAIADVSHYVQRESALDTEAYNRATSVYFPERVIPMLPEVLSNGLCSLNPDVDRLCMVCEMQFDANGKMTSSDFFDAVMHSHARLTYNKVSAMLEDNHQTLREEYSDVLPHLETLFDLYKALITQRKKRGSIDFETTETRIVFDENKRIDSIVPTSRNEAHKIIEECMISANIAAATFLEKHEIPGLYRVHGGPKEDKMDDVRDFIQGLGLKFKKGGKIAAQDYARIINQVKDRADFHLIQTVLLRSLSQAVYSPDNEGHFGLSLENYAHFTSPIRRYPDLLVHRAIRHIIEGNKVGKFFYRHSDMVTLGEHCSANERRADEATRDAVSALKCEFMQSRIGETYPGVITSVTGFGLFIELNDIYVEGLVHITNLPKDYYQFEPVTHRLIGERTGQVFQLGDAVTVTVAGVNLDERKIDFELISHDEDRKPAEVIPFDKALADKKKAKKERKKDRKKSKDKKRKSSSNDQDVAVKQAASKKTSTKNLAANSKDSKKAETSKTPANKTAKKKTAVKKAPLKKKVVAKKTVTVKKNSSASSKASAEIQLMTAMKQVALEKTAAAKKVAAAEKKLLAAAKKLESAEKKLAAKKTTAKKKVAPKKKVVKKKAAPKKKEVKKAPAKKAPVKKKVVKKAPVKKAPVKKKVVKKAPAKKAPAKKKAAVKKKARKK